MTGNPASGRQRHIVRHTRASAPKPGFAGPGHTAVEVVGSNDLARTNPFVLLMDDRLEFTPGQPVGEAHPHAGLETVTLMLDGSLDDAAEGLLGPGDLAWMTAGRGLIHNEDVAATGYARILQLWIALPGAVRNGDPALQIVRKATLPVRREPGVEARLYSGSSGDLVSPTRNLVPTTMVDFVLAPGASVVQELPGSHTAFLYVVDGSISVADETLSEGSVGWLDSHPETATFAKLDAGASGGRAVLYAGARQDESFVQRGPFVAGSQAELATFYAAFRAGTFRKISDIVATA